MPQNQKETQSFETFAPEAMSQIIIDSSAETEESWSPLGLQATLRT